MDERMEEVGGKGMIRNNTSKATQDYSMLAENLLSWINVGA